MEIFYTLKIFGFLLFSYLLGSIPCGLVLTRLFTSKNITRMGSKNIGATNVSRIAGLKLGALTLAGDMIKGAFPVYLACLIISNDHGWNEIQVLLTAFFAFCGHIYPVYMKFKNGGKGVATAGGCFFVIAPVACIAAVFVFTIAVFLFNRVSVASLAAATVLPFFLWPATHSGNITVFSVVITAFIYLRHRENIKRLLSGTEPVLFKKKD